jgi:hypothetical protein
MRRWLRRQLSSLSKRRKEILRHGTGLPIAGGIVGILAGAGVQEEGEGIVNAALRAFVEGQLEPWHLLVFMAVYVGWEKWGKGLTAEDEE